MNDEVKGTTAAQDAEPRLSEQDLRLHCLNLAHTHSFEAEKVVKCAETYLKFIKGESDAEEEAQ